MQGQCRGPVRRLDAVASGAEVRIDARGVSCISSAIAGSRAGGLAKDVTGAEGQGISGRRENGSRFPVATSDEAISAGKVSLRAWGQVRGRALERGPAKVLTARARASRRNLPSRIRHRRARRRAADIGVRARFLVSILRIMIVSFLQKSENRGAGAAASADAIAAGSKAVTVGSNCCGR
jgi:hypothetical protein